MPGAMRLPDDPRWLQIAFLGSFLLVGIIAYGVVPAWEPPLTIGAACVTQFVMARIFRARDAGYLSAIVTGCGLSLLCRSDLTYIPPLAAFLAISSKFLLRIRGKHIFNPANFGLVALMLATPHAWSSPSQWGERGLLLAWFLLLGLAVVHRAFRMDITIAFLCAHLLFKGGRILYLGDTLRVLLHQLEVGSLIVFAFFMISDPRTTPDRRVGRIAFAFIVAGLGFYLQAFKWIQQGLLYSLFFLSPLVPLIDRLLPSVRYRWGRPGDAGNSGNERNDACTDLATLPSPSR